MNPENYYKETPQERRVRRHTEDMLENPDRHMITKPIYDYEEALNLCPFCCEGLRDKYIFDPRTRQFVRNDESNKP